MSMTNKEYREHEGISKSSLFKISKSPLHFKYAMDNPEENDTEALLFGRAVHKWILEPDTFYEEFAIMPTVDRRTNAGKEVYAKFLTLSEDKDVITDDMFTKIKEMADVVNSNEAAKKLICGEHEHSFFGRTSRQVNRVNADLIFWQKSVADILLSITKQRIAQKHLIL